MIPPTPIALFNFKFKETKESSLPNSHPGGIGGEDSESFVNGSSTSLFVGRILELDAKVLFFHDNFVSVTLFLVLYLLDL